FLAVVYNALSEMGYGDKLIIDLGLVHQNDYYTGLVFSAYAEGSGAKILSGGRYDNLLSSFGMDSSACGFAINIDDLVKTLNPSEYSATAAPERLVVAEGGKEIDALRYMAQLQEQKIAAEFCLLEDVGDAMAYARDRGIKHVDIVTDGIETVDSPEDKQ
ncbi:MAG: ATP phosphoribosyltransferase regulatory subunit, partial [Ruminococcaceae bacterium]|nr:ATP phosphoribosyltransferase regulatory subunit [Oscillospiraceae bacterium]